jgi:hypothetical protein
VHVDFAHCIFTSFFFFFSLILCVSFHFSFFHFVSFSSTFFLPLIFIILFHYYLFLCSFSFMSSFTSSYFFSLSFSFLIFIIATLHGPRGFAALSAFTTGSGLAAYSFRCRCGARRGCRGAVADSTIAGVVAGVYDLRGGRD